MKLRIFYNSSIPFYLGGMDGITLYPCVFINKSKEEAIRIRLLQHELIHVEQIKRVGFFKFYLSYAVEYFKNLLRLKDSRAAYLQISYEQEAYSRQYTFELPEEFK